MMILAAMVAALLSAAPAAEAVPLGSLRSADPTLVRDGTRWVALSTNESLGAPYAKACDPNDPVWDKGFAYVPVRIGSAPDQLADCWAGDALPSGPGPWATRPWVNLQWAPSLAQINGVWWLFYATQRAGSGQQCIGVAAGDRATGPNWLHPASPLVCPSGGRWAIDPEIFYDRQTQAWYLLWREDPGPCDSFLHVQRFNPGTGLLTGTVRRLMTATTPALGFDEIPGVGSCPGGISHIIENPTMVRADSGELWLFFSANAWDSANYATGWALCGTASPVVGGQCALVNALPGGARNRPIWGSSGRTAVTPGDPTPYEAFPDLPGLGGMSLATPDPTAAAPQTVYATGHILWGDPSRLRTQVVFRLDTRDVVPHLVEF
jgi:arabinan endo-1,5-alpha-L-arabinosidase